MGKKARTAAVAVDEKKKLGAARRLKYEPELALANHHQQSLLERRSATPGTVKDYTKRIEDFMAWVLVCLNMVNVALSCEVKLESAPLLEALLMEYFDHLFLEGYPAHAGEKLFAAVLSLQPQLNVSRCLPRLHRALKGWNRLAPAKSRDSCSFNFPRPGRDGTVRCKYCQTFSV